MEITAVRSDSVYAKLMAAPVERRNDIYRYELMMPFARKWACYGVPMRAATENGYDVIMAGGMLGHLAPVKVDRTWARQVELLSADGLWARCQRAIARSLACFAEGGIGLPVQKYLYTILLAEPENPYVALSEGYSGDGGIPGYIFAWLVPSGRTLARLPAALAHETNHNVRYQFIRWRPDVTLGEMIVSEGLAENFATALYGEEMAGPWVSGTDEETLAAVKPVIRAGLGVRGLAEMNAYLYGDDIAVLQGGEPVGLPYCAGYACGYHLIRHYLRKTGKGIAEATLLPADEILDAVEEFWDGQETALGT